MTIDFEFQCLGCGILTDCVSNFGDQTRPRAGDRVICFYCGILMVFTVDGVRHPTIVEAALAANDPRIQKARQMASLNIRRRQAGSN